MATVYDSFQIENSYAVTKKTHQSLMYSLWKVFLYWSARNYSSCAKTTYYKYNVTHLGCLRGGRLVAWPGPRLSSGRGILLQRAIKRMHFYERKIFCSKGKLQMCFCTQGPLMWMTVGVRLDHECIMIQRNAPSVCVFVCVWRICENGDGNSLLRSPTQDHCERSTPSKAKIKDCVHKWVWLVTSIP